MSDAYVYFIQADDDGPIKIGFTADDPKKRLNQLQTGNHATLKLLGAITGTTAKERELHAALAEWRLQGEWFQPHPTVIELVQKTLADQSEHDCGGVHCSFCGNCQRNVYCMVAGPGDNLYICGPCIAICTEIAGEQLLKTAKTLFPDSEMDLGYAA